MKFQIVPMREIKGKISPDMRKVVAVVEISGARLHVKLMDGRYRSQLARLFEEPGFTRELSVKREDGSVIDVGLREREPEDPVLLEFLPARLSMLGLSIVMGQEE